MPCPGTGPYATSPSRPGGTAGSAARPVPSTKWRLPPARPPGKSHIVRPSVLCHRRGITSRRAPASGAASPSRPPTLAGAWWSLAASLRTPPLRRLSALLSPGRPGPEALPEGCPRVPTGCRQPLSGLRDL
ncbi:hypothetical protein GCM10015536_27820 [Streptomyces griseomycini]|nr:hypothetical protein GCM10015536_27820 [Streptomyces griseomycini]